MKIRSLCIATAIALSGCNAKEPSAIQGYVEGDFVRVAAPFAGTLTRLEVQRGQAVAPGTALFQLESENEESARREAGERARRAEAMATDVRKGLRPSEIAAVRAQLSQAEVTAANSSRELARQEDLVAKGFVSRQRADEARTARDRDRARVMELQAQLATANAGTRPDEVRAAEAEAGAAQAALAQADWRVRQKAVAATVGGTVTDTLYVQGEWVPAGAPVVSMLPPGNVKVRFYVSETRLGAIKMGQAATIRCDGCPAPVSASISYISPQAEFTPPVLYTRENRAKLVFLVEARPAPADGMKLHPGQPVDVELK